MKLNILEYFQPEPPIVLRERYSLVQRLSVTRRMQTFLAQDLHAPGHPECIVKQLHVPAERFTELSAVRKLFQTEANGLSRLETHDCIPQLLAHFEEEGEFYFVQEKIDGHSLAEELASPVPWSDQKVVALLNDLLSTLEHLHKNRVVHLNLQPSTLIRRGEDARLAMVSSGAFQQASAQVIAPGPGIGTPPLFNTSPYMPDEQIAGHPDPSSDIYAIGLIAIQALTGRRPEDIQAHPQTRELYWHSLASLRHPDLLALLDSLVRYNYRTRCQTASDALAALSALPPEITWFAPVTEVPVNEAPARQLFAPSVASSAVTTDERKDAIVFRSAVENRIDKNKKQLQPIVAPIAVRETIQKQQLSRNPTFRRIALPVGAGILALLGVSTLLVWRLPNSVFVREETSPVLAGANVPEPSANSTDALLSERREDAAEVLEAEAEVARADNSEPDISNSQTEAAPSDNFVVEDRVVSDSLVAEDSVAEDSIEDTGRAVAEGAIALAPEAAKSTVNRFYDFVASRSWESARSLLSDDMAARLEPDFFYQFQDVSVENVRIVNQSPDAADLLIQNTYVYLDGSFQQEERNYTVQMVNNQPKIVDTAFVEVTRGRR